jgi:arabinogalactan endo-1,4-beta-galactosidase
MIRTVKYIVLLLIMLTAASCGDPKPSPGPDNLSKVNFAKGADVSWVTQMERDGIKFYNAQGTEMECMALLKSLGMNTIRLRVWVNPVDGWNGKDDLLVKAKRAKALGMRLMIDFHYSDSWADPGKQNKPAAWVNLPFEELKGALVSHTIEILEALKGEGIYPEWVQVGNETSDGMLWPDGRASVNMKNYTELHNAGYRAVKEVFPESKVILHIDRGDSGVHYNWLLDGMAVHAAQYDVIGMSLYPDPGNWQYINEACLINMKALIGKYNKDIMICEVGMSWDQPEICKGFLIDLIDKALEKSDGRCLGILYWEPQGFVNWSHYTKAAFDNTGRPTVALDAFRD